MTMARNSRAWRTILLTITIFSLSLPAYAKYGGGTGEPNDPYQIATHEDLMLLGESPEDYDKHFILNADIDLDPNLPGRKVFDKAVIAPDVNDTQEGFQGSSFAGVFDGGGHTISHLTITGGSFLGLFGKLESGAVVKNLGLVDVNLAGTGDYIGGLLAYNASGSVTRCYSTGEITGGSYVGGLLAYNGRGTVTQCYSTSAVSGNRCVGGLVGRNYYGRISTSYSSASVSGTGDAVGGLAGDNVGGSISTSHSSGTVTGNDDVGGLVGLNTATYTGVGDVSWLAGGTLGSIATSYSTCAVSGDAYIGGLVGDNAGRVATSYSTGLVKGNLRVGGLVGSGSTSYVTASFWNTETSGRTTSGGGTGKTTAEMQTAEVFLEAGWDFVDEVANGTCDYWQISPGDYPRLCYHPGKSPTMPEGLGTAEQPYLIRDARDLGTVWLEPLAHYRLAQSIDLSGITWSMAVIPWFGGSFEGSGYLISNLHIQGAEYLGLFGQLGSTASVSSLGLETVEVVGTGGFVGALAGLNKGAIAASYDSGSVSGSSDVGGIVGCNWAGSIAESYSSGSVGGTWNVGGLVGSNMGSAANCYSTGFVNGYDSVGGLVGDNVGGMITFCYSAGTVAPTGEGATDTGGLVGKNCEWVVIRSICGTLTACFWDIVYRTELFGIFVS